MTKKICFLGIALVGIFCSNISIANKEEAALTKAEKSNPIFGFVYGLQEYALAAGHICSIPDAQDAVNAINQHVQNAPASQKPQLNTPFTFASNVKGNPIEWRCIVHPNNQFFCSGKNILPCFNGSKNVITQGQEKFHVSGQGNWIINNIPTINQALYFCNWCASEGNMSYGNIGCEFGQSVMYIPDVYVIENQQLGGTWTCQFPPQSPGYICTNPDNPLVVIEGSSLDPSPQCPPITLD